MLPSDHFVRMYNELFKMLEEKGHDHLQRYWLDVSKLQETILGPYIARDGLKGMYDYWERIRIEENCDAEIAYDEEHFEFRMLRCPSLSKALDNDGGACPYYCDHCAGWIYPVIEKYGYYPVTDIISRSEPVCLFRVFKDKAKAEVARREAQLLADPYGKYS
ncbi:MAG TPA: hypothetical protein PLG43_03565 [Spirochaetia bacterium]|nr:hypothetical protein [Spirochaetia bacterium]